MIGIYASLERNRRVYDRVIGGREAHTERPRLPESQSRAASVVTGWATPEALTDFAPNMRANMSLPYSPDPPDTRRESAGYSLSPAPADPLETAELFTLAAEAEERFVSQNLEREEW